MRSKTNNEAAARCRKAWKAHPNCKVAWCCHHGVRVESLHGTAEERIRYILDHKPHDEIIVRLDNFRPCLSLSAVKAAERERVKADRELQKVNKAIDKKEDEVEKLRRRLEHMEDELQTLEDRRDDLDDNLPDLVDVLCDVSANQMARAHTKDVPNHDWDVEYDCVRGTSNG